MSRFQQELVDVPNTGVVDLGIVYSCDDWLTNSNCWYRSRSLGCEQTQITREMDETVMERTKLTSCTV